MPGRVTPLVATGRLQIKYTSDLTHVLNTLLNLYVSDHTLIQDRLGTAISAATFAALIVTTIKPLFAPTVTFDTWILQEYVSGAYEPTIEGSLGTPGTNVDPTIKGTAWTFTMRDLNNKEMSLRLLGMIDGGPVKVAYAALGAPEKAVVDEYVNTAAGHIGAARTGRGGVTFPSFLNLVVTQNRKSRRRLGLV